jgi:3-dehydroquinate synthetase
VCGLDPAVCAETAELLDRHGLPLAAPGLTEDDVLGALRQDKKRVGGTPRFVLLEAVGRPVWGVEVEERLVREAVARALALSAPAGSG